MTSRGRIAAILAAGVMLVVGVGVGFGFSSAVKAQPQPNDDSRSVTWCVDQILGADSRCSEAAGWLNVLPEVTDGGQRLAETSSCDAVPVPPGWVPALVTGPTWDGIVPATIYTANKESQLPSQATLDAACVLLPASSWLLTGIGGSHPVDPYVVAGIDLDAGESIDDWNPAPPVWVP